MAVRTSAVESARAPSRSPRRAFRSGWYMTGLRLLNARPNGWFGLRERTLALKRSARRARAHADAPASDRLAPAGHRTVGNREARAMPHGGAAVPRRAETLVPRVRWSAVESTGGEPWRASAANPIQPKAGRSSIPAIRQSPARREPAKTYAPTAAGSAPRRARLAAAAVGLLSGSRAGRVEHRGAPRRSRPSQSRRAASRPQIMPEQKDVTPMVDVDLERLQQEDE